MAVLRTTDALRRDADAARPSFPGPLLLRVLTASTRVSTHSPLLPHTHARTHGLHVRGLPRSFLLYGYFASSHSHIGRTY